MVQFNQLVIVFMFASIHPNSKSIALKLKLNLDIEDDDSTEIEINPEDLSKSHPHRHKHQKPDNPDENEDNKLSHFFDIDSATDSASREPKTIKNRSSFPDEPTEEEGYDKDYPYAEIKLYMQERPYLQKYLSPPLPEIGNRFGVTHDQLENDEETLCKGLINEQYRPQKLKNIHGMERFIVNDEEYQQFIRTEKCSSESSRCHNLNMFGSTAHSCVQRYSTRRLVIYTNNSYNEIDDFAIPCCCVCIVKNDGNSLINYLTGSFSSPVDQ